MKRGGRRPRRRREKPVGLLIRLRAVPDPVAQVIATERAQHLHEALDALEPREGAIVRAIWGIGRPRTTYRECARTWGVSSGRIRQIAERALRRIARSPRARRLVATDEPRDGSATDVLWRIA